MIGMPTLVECKTLEENVLFAKENEFDFLELNLNFPYIREYLETGKALPSGIKYTLHFLDDADFIYDEVSEGYILFLEKYISNYSGIIGQVNIHLNLGPIQTLSGKKIYLNALYFDSYYNSFKNNLYKLINMLKKYKMDLVIENVKSLEHTIKCFNHLKNDGFSFTYDVGHDATSSFMLHQFMIENINQYKECHLHDSNGKADHLSLGQGTIDYNQYKELFKDKYLLIEVKTKSDLIDSIKKIK